MVGGGETRGDLREVTRITAVVSTDHDHQIRLVFLNKVANGVLAVLSRAANGIERIKPCCQLLMAVALRYRSTHHFCDLVRLSHELQRSRRPAHIFRRFSKRSTPNHKSYRQ